MTLFYKTKFFLELRTNFKVYIKWWCRCHGWHCKQISNTKLVFAIQGSETCMLFLLCSFIRCISVLCSCCFAYVYLDDCVHYTVRILVIVYHNSQLFSISSQIFFAFIFTYFIRFSYSSKKKSMRARARVPRKQFANIFHLDDFLKIIAKFRPNFINY